ncbi:MAG: molecular chaperone HtpG [Ruminococcaceae bacterium]|nr:molecular chaperone HtpG [Oscillospiraceae bacterium]
MRTKQFKAESKKLLDMMINSIYTNKEIFLRELISNASDAVDKLYFRSLTDDSIGLNRADFCIRLSADVDNRLLTISDNGIGMTAEELENNLGTIAKSGSLDFKNNNEKNEEIDVIGQFGVGFYSAFMVADKVTVISRAFGEETANRWESKGAEGYTIAPCEKETVGTDIILHIKADTEEEKYGEFLDAYRLSSLVKKYSDYIRYPVKMFFNTRKKVEGSEDEYEDVAEDRTLNSMIPLWKKNKSEITDEEYNQFYKDKFYDYENPLKVIHTKTEGQATYNSLLYIPAHAPFDYYSKDFEKGLALYSKGVLITEKCADLLPDYFSFVKGLVDSEDLSLNISRETLQHDYQLRLIAKTVEKKIKSELAKMLNNDRETYEKFFEAFGTQLKFGVYSEYGRHKDAVADLLLFKSSFEDKFVTVEEYISRMPEDQKAIYYAAGETVDKINMLPQADAVKAKGYELLYFTDYVDEFAIQMLREVDGKEFVNICAENADFGTDEEKETVKAKNEACKDMLDFMAESLGDDVTAVRFTENLGNHPVCLVSEGGLSSEMERVLNAMPGASGVKASLVLEINANHAIADKLTDLFENDRDTLDKYAKLLNAQARLIGGMSIDNPAQFSSLICELML